MVRREHLILWLPVLFGGGIGLYFSLKSEPAPWVGGTAVLLACGGLALALRLRGFGVAAIAFLALFMVAAGFADAALRAHMVAAPVLAEETRPVTVEGTVAAIDPLGEEAGARLILRDLAIEDMEIVPERIRVRATKLAPGAVQVGDRVRFRGKLNPPRAPVAPGAFDFQRYSWFQRIGGYGFAFSAPEIVSDAAGEGFIYKARQAMQHRIVSVIHGGPGAVAIAFMTGSQTAISQGDANDFRASGLAHMLSVSGLHFAIVAGILFFTVRLLLVALFPKFAVRRPVKKYAAVIAMAGIVAYLAIVGASVPAVRSVLMTGAAMLAIMADRNPFSMRIIALAALVILALTPEALITASFQMSFGAVAALVWFYERTRNMWAKAAKLGWLGKPLVYVGGICMTTVVASLATAPFSLYHFQQLPLYGVVANFLAAPVLSFIVMPAIIVAYLLMPLGLDAPVLKIIGFGNDLILRIAHAVAVIPHATWMPAAWPVAALVLMVAAGLWLLLSNGRWMALAGLPMVAAVIVILLTPKPDMFVADDGKLAAVADADGLLLSDRVHDKTDAAEWARINGSDPKANVRWDQEGGPAKCDEYACRLSVRGQNISYIKKMQALAEECAWADVVIGPMPVRDCRAAHRIGYYELREQGAHALYLSPEAARIETVQQARGRRPWSDYINENR